MSENKGEPTPGPWKATCIQDEEHGPAFWLIDACPAPNMETEVAEICVKPGDRSEANARLIAAAPDLLEAAELQQEAELIWGNCPECQETQSWPELCEHCFESADKARVARMNAIAKARGETE